MNNAELVIQKLKTYQGSLLSTKWKVPKTHRQFNFALNRVIKLYYSMQNRQLFYPELVQVVKQLAVYFKMYIIKQRPDKIPYYLTELDEMINFVAPIEFVRIEKVRVKESKRCSVCRVPLAYPAYLIYATKDGTEVRSEPTGIFCLQQLHGYLNDFKQSLEVEWELDAILTGVMDNGREALKAV
jgi:hypothetical protein